ncbi:DNA gyrase inhibitor YacG [Xinfangfangia sp. D13-10-4-6]|uniref:DNA gyrase inhibitor YacG n=1 Tax=Pseudogemmobacter hezensis TaxID=2737662 RepID=UPI001556B84C|nr:DNA gyrase inhibitor YacG [Pseudogemmobacter hezensis]
MTCPVCGKPTEAASRPFCSKRCADVDLARWLGGSYRIAGTESPDADAEIPDDDAQGPGASARP